MGHDIGIVSMVHAAIPRAYPKGHTMKINAVQWTWIDYRCIRVGMQRDLWEVR